MATKYRFSLEEFERIFSGVRQVELIEGEVYQMSPVGSKHVFKVMQLGGLLTERLSKRVLVSIQNPLRIAGNSKNSEPQPDIVLLEPPIEKYQNRIPEAKDALLVVEVSDSTLEYDQTTKKAVYAQAGIPEYWIVNLIENVLEIYREPTLEGYQTQFKLNSGEVVAFMGEWLEVH